MTEEVSDPTCLWKPAWKLAALLGGEVIYIVRKAADIQAYIQDTART